MRKSVYNLGDKKKTVLTEYDPHWARGGRTHTMSPSTDFKSVASAFSACYPALPAKGQPWRVEGNRFKIRGAPKTCFEPLCAVSCTMQISKHVNKETYRCQNELDSDKQSNSQNSYHKDLFILQRTGFSSNFPGRSSLLFLRAEKVPKASRMREIPIEMVRFGNFHSKICMINLLCLPFLLLFNTR